MRQFEIREVVSDALVVIIDATDQLEASEHAMWWTDEFGTVCYASEVTGVHDMMRKVGRTS